jgi:hypothetical protein
LPFPRAPQGFAYGLPPPLRPTPPVGSGRHRRRGYAARASPLSDLQPRKPPLRCPHRPVGGASGRGARPLVPGATGARHAPPCPGPLARTVRVRQPLCGAAVHGPASLRSAIIQRHPSQGSPSLLCMPTSFHLIGHHAHLLPPHPVCLGLHLIRSPAPGPAGL